MARNAQSRENLGSLDHRSRRSRDTETISRWRAYTSATIAWLQNVYEPANRTDAAAAASSDPLSSNATRTISPHASAASIAETRFIAYAWLVKNGTTGRATA